VFFFFFLAFGLLISKQSVENWRMRTANHQQD